MYIAYDPDNKVFYATDEMSKAVVVDGDILACKTVGEAIDLAASYSKSLDSNPPMGVTVHHCEKRGRYVVSLNGERGCKACG